jgi:hypothetical protein
MPKQTAPCTASSSVCAREHGTLPMESMTSCHCRCFDQPQTKKMLVSHHAAPLNSINAGTQEICGRIESP